MIRRGIASSLAALWIASAPVLASAAGAPPAIRSMGAGLRFVSWTIERGDTTVTLDQRLLPVDASVELSHRATVAAGIEVSGADLEARDDASASGAAGGWIDLRVRPHAGWLLAVGGSFPMRSNSLSLEEARLTGWLEETGLQMPASSLAFAPAIELRAAREFPLGRDRRAAFAASWIHRASYVLYEDESTLDPGSRLRIAGAYESIVAGGRLEASAGYAREAFTGVEQESRYRDGDRTRLALRWVRPGPAEWDVRMGVFLQADGEGAASWESPAGGSVWSGGVALRGGLDWSWVASMEAWRSSGFDELLGDLTAIRPGAGIERRFGGQRIALHAAPAFGFGDDDLALRGWSLRMEWSLVP